MTNIKHQKDTAEHAAKDSACKTDAAYEPAGSTMSKSMHNGVEVWCDCCSCEAEPYWVEAMQELDE